MTGDILGWRKHRIEALELALTQSRAETAAVIERAAAIAYETAHNTSDISKIRDAIRALATPDQSAALDAVRADAMREAAEYMQRYSHTHMTVNEILAAIKGAKA
jgi:hypothetical protein